MTQSQLPRRWTSDHNHIYYHNGITIASLNAHSLHFFSAILAPQMPKHTSLIGFARTYFNEYLHISFKLSLVHFLIFEAVYLSIFQRFYQRKKWMTYCIPSVGKKRSLSTMKVIDGQAFHWIGCRYCFNQEHSVQKTVECLEAGCDKFNLCYYQIPLCVPNTNWRKSKER